MQYRMNPYLDKIFFHVQLTLATYTTKVSHSEYSTVSKCS